MDAILISIFRQDLRDLMDFFRLRRGALSAEGRSSCQSCWSCLKNFQCGMDSILFRLFRQDLQDHGGSFFRLRRGSLSAEGRFILTILLILSDFCFLFREAVNTFLSASICVGLRLIYSFFYFLPQTHADWRRRLDFLFACGETLLARRPLYLVNPARLGIA